MGGRSGVESSAGTYTQSASAPLPPGPVAYAIRPSGETEASLRRDSRALIAAIIASRFGLFCRAMEEASETSPGSPRLARAARASRAAVRTRALESSKHAAAAEANSEMGDMAAVPQFRVATRTNWRAASRRRTVERPRATAASWSNAPKIGLGPRRRIRAAPSRTAPGTPRAAIAAGFSRSHVSLAVSTTFQMTRSVAAERRGCRPPSEAAQRTRAVSWPVASSASTAPGRLSAVPSARTPTKRRRQSSWKKL